MNYIFAKESNKEPIDMNFSISVVVPVYNVEPYLRRCVDSILSQTYIDFKVILVDDGCQDLSGILCDEYCLNHTNFTVIHKQNGGLSSARNAGIDLSNTKYLIFIDADDMIHSRTLELEKNILEKQKADAVICSLRRFNSADTNSLNKPIMHLGEIKVVSGIEMLEISYQSLYSPNFVSSCGRLYKRKLFKDVRFPVGRLFEDEFTTYKLYYQCSNVVILDLELYYYFINDSGITRNLTLTKRFDEYDSQVERIYYYKNNGCQKLFDLALKCFLESAKWDLKAVNNHEQDFPKYKGARLQKQYVEMLKYARSEKLLSFLDDFDYYALALPKLSVFLRFQWKIIHFFDKMKKRDM